VLRWLCALLVAGVLSGFAFLLLSGRYINDGPVLLRISQHHGLHVGDLFVIAGWVVAMTAVVVLTLKPSREAPH
jgi:hypothetical protein